MPKTLYLTMGINPELKAELQQLAREEEQTLTNFCEIHFRRIAARQSGKAKIQAPRRGARTAHLTIRISKELEETLQKLAGDDYRTLTEFFEMQLHRIVAAHKARSGYEMLRRRPKYARIATNINAALKAELARLADQDHRSLTDFIELQLRQIGDARGAKRKRPFPLRQTRAARLTTRIDREIKTALQRLAGAEYRTLTDFIEIELHRIVAAHKAKRLRLSQVTRSAR